MSGAKYWVFVGRVNLFGSIARVNDNIVGIACHVYSWNILVGYCLARSTPTVLLISIMILISDGLSGIMTIGELLVKSLDKTLKWCGTCKALDVRQ